MFWNKKNKGSRHSAADAAAAERVEELKTIAEARRGSKSSASSEILMGEGLSQLLGEGAPDARENEGQVPGENASADAGAFRGAGDVGKDADRRESRLAARRLEERRKARAEQKGLAVEQEEVLSSEPLRAIPDEEAPPVKAEPQLAADCSAEEELLPNAEQPYEAEASLDALGEAFCADGQVSEADGKGTPPSLSGLEDLFAARIREKEQELAADSSDWDENSPIDFSFDESQRLGGYAAFLASQKDSFFEPIQQEAKKRGKEVAVSVHAQLTSLDAFVEDCRIRTGRKGSGVPRRTEDFNPAVSQGREDRFEDLIRGESFRFSDATAGGLDLGWDGKSVEGDGAFGAAFDMADALAAVDEQLDAPSRRPTRGFWKKGETARARDDVLSFVFAPEADCAADGESVREDVFAALAALDFSGADEAGLKAPRSGEARLEAHDAGEAAAPSADLAPSVDAAPSAGARAVAAGVSDADASSMSYSAASADCSVFDIPSADSNQASSLFERISAASEELAFGVPAAASASAGGFGDDEKDKLLALFSKDEDAGADAEAVADADAAQDADAEAVADADAAQDADAEAVADADAEADADKIEAVEPDADKVEAAAPAAEPREPEEQVAAAEPVEGEVAEQAELAAAAGEAFDAVEEIEADEEAETAGEEEEAARVEAAGIVEDLLVSNEAAELIEPSEEDAEPIELPEEDAESIELPEEDVEPLVSQEASEDSPVLAEAVEPDGGADSAKAQELDWTEEPSDQVEPEAAACDFAEDADGTCDMAEPMLRAELEEPAGATEALGALPLEESVDEIVPEAEEPADDAAVEDELPADDIVLEVEEAAESEELSADSLADVEEPAVDVCVIDALEEDELADDWEDGSFGIEPSEAEENSGDELAPLDEALDSERTEAECLGEPEAAACDSAEDADEPEDAVCVSEGQEQKDTGSEEDELPDETSVDLSLSPESEEDEPPAAELESEEEEPPAAEFASEEDEPSAAELVDEILPSEPGVACDGLSSELEDAESSDANDEEDSKEDSDWALLPDANDEELVADSPFFGASSRQSLDESEPASEAQQTVGFAQARKALEASASLLAGGEKPNATRIWVASVSSRDKNAEVLPDEKQAVANRSQKDSSSDQKSINWDPEQEKSDSVPIRGRHAAAPGKLKKNAWQADVLGKKGYITIDQDTMDRAAEMNERAVLRSVAAESANQAARDIGAARQSEAQKRRERDEQWRRDLERKRQLEEENRRLEEEAYQREIARQQEVQRQREASERQHQRMLREVLSQSSRDDCFNEASSWSLQDARFNGSEAYKAYRMRGAALSHDDEACSAEMPRPKIPKHSKPSQMQEGFLPYDASEAQDAVRNRLRAQRREKGSISVDHSDREDDQIKYERWLRD